MQHHVIGCTFTRLWREEAIVSAKITSWMLCDMKQDETEALYIIQKLMFCT
jgi:hypothetical protein